MKRALLITTFLSCFVFAFAGNDDRAGEAGATQLLINPWARCSGWAGANGASIIGLESMYLNVAGISHIPKTEVLFTRTNWLKGTDIAINAFGFSQRVGDEGVMAMSIVSFNLGEIDVTTYQNPQGGIGTFKPQFSNINLAYAKEFSNSIYGGINLKVINEAISNVQARGFALDAGIQYITGDREQLKFGIAMKNWGTRMRYSGDGLSLRAVLNRDDELTISQRSNSFELPSLLNISASYRIDAGESHKIETCATYTSNSFTRDQIRLGVSYMFKKYLVLRGGFMYEEGIFDVKTRKTALTGPSAGFSFQIPYGEDGTLFSVDYSYRATQPFGGTHSFGVRLKL